MLGPLQVIGDDGPVSPGAPKQRAVLAELLLHEGRVVPRDRLVDAVWGDLPPPTANTALQVYVHGLRRSLGPDRIETVGTGYRVRLEPGELDLQRFTSLTGRAERELAEGRVEESVRDSEAALAMWSGPPLADLSALPVAAAAVPRLEELRLGAAELLVTALLELGEHERLLPDLDALIAAHPYRERLRELQILALYRAGRQKDALDVYRSVRAVLVEELGVEPGPRLQELERAVLRQDPILAAPAAARAAARIRLPAPATALIGRRLEVAAVESLMREEGIRLVTLTGTGGTGKTRLALAVAESLAADHRDGAAFVDLSAITAPEPLLPAIARALEVPETDDDVERGLLDYLSDRSLLLVLDNLEQLGGSVRPVAALLAAAPRLRVVATSRVPLRLSGEHEYPVPPLPVPGARTERFEEIAANDSVRLFVARARAVEPLFALTDTNAASVAAVCRRLDGLPLAVELAAAWSKVLDPPQIEARLGRALDLLVAGARDLPERQQTLRATLDWSYALLTEGAQHLLASLAVFSGGWTLDGAAEIVGSDPLGDLTTLVDHSLVRQEHGRFSLLETIRAYALARLSRLGLEDECHRRHARYFAGVAGQAYADILVGGESEAAAFALLDAEADNLDAAVAWAMEAGDLETEVEIAVALRWYWLVRGRLGEGLRVFEHAIEASRGMPGVHAAVLSSAGMFNTRRGDHQAARRQLQAARLLFAELGEDEEETRCVAELGALAVDEGALDVAADLYREAAERFGKLGNGQRQAVALGNLAAIAAREGDQATAAEYSGRAIELQRASGDLDGLAVSLANAGRARLELGDEAAARDALHESLEIARRLDYRMLLAYLLGSAAFFALRKSRAEQAAFLVGGAAAMFAAIGMPVPPEETAEHRRALEHAEAALGGAAAEERRLEGRAAPLETLVELAFAVM